MPKSFSIFDDADPQDLADAIVRQQEYIFDLDRRREALSSNTEPWAYRPATRYAAQVQRHLDREIRLESKTLQDMRRALKAKAAT